MPRTPLALPDFPWDSLTPFADRARSHPDGFVDLSVGSPVDPTPAVVARALAEATDAHAYPQTAGTPALREAIVDWYARRRGADDLTVANVMPTIGSKELVGLLPLLLGLGPGDVVVHPAIAYPTYAIGAAVVGARAVASDDPAEWPAETKLVWLNSPGNPTGSVLSVEQLRAAVARARELGAVIVNDECYAELVWDSSEPAPSILDYRVIEGVRSNVLSVYSLSKQSNLAGYRAAFVAGCSNLIGEILAVRKHLGLIPPAPVQAAMIAALADEEHVAHQRELYRARRAKLVPALQRAGYRIDDSEAGLYLWATKGLDAWATVSELADAGVLVVPGSFYGEEPATHVRVALTASDANIAEAVARLDLLS
ncbi:succinyldiaminopimelate transaminase [Microbacteriaceae bacterium SG_E_30_P1]|uniref:Aminotransferase n=1 Tax=Antiquaquibacter oligotrophicus TaxID=2880260 RepID=A0ABT6KKL3_9MICO|nr:succinyldiaminopimelate transaminase [Antiquaquibacter oligotrophicus]MDH6180394.1 succinyldiaminopimelate transaminase [Antiquaquibacter oligotrophicus]UDF13865.1 succinyldiaminopimelate transaminase [Antiquaquibacter oligotrophicus]